MADRQSHGAVPGDGAAETPGKLVGALSAGLKIVRHLIERDTPVGVSQVARELGLNPSTCYNLLRTLVHEGLIAFDPATKGYQLGLGLLELTRGLSERDRLVRFVHRRLEELAREHRITVTLWQRLDAERVVLVDRVDGESQIRVHMTVGQRLPLYLAALGRCMAAYSGLSREDLRREFDKLRWERSPTFENYWDDIQAVKRSGFAVDRDNFALGVTTASSPILSADGQAAMCMSAVGFTAQLTEAPLAALTADLSRHTAEVSFANGYRRGAEDIPRGGEGRRQPGTAPARKPRPPGRPRPLGSGKASAD